MIMKKQHTFDIVSQRKLGIVDTELNNNNNITIDTSGNGKYLGYFFRKIYN